MASKAVSKDTVNTVIAVTIILGVIFIAFALFVIYWMYMRSIDRKERKEQIITERLARSDGDRRSKGEHSKASEKSERYMNYGPKGRKTDLVGRRRFSQ